MEFKERLRYLRKEKGWTQGELASLLNYGYTAISNYESGRNEPSIKDLKKIAKVFNVSMDYLICVNDERNPFTESKDAEDFINLKNNYLLLNDKSKSELASYIEWLIERQNRNVQSARRNASPLPVSLKVAEPKSTYKTKKLTPEEIAALRRQETNPETKKEP